VTTIVGHRDGWMVADKRCSFDGSIAPFETTKVRRASGVLIGFAGHPAHADFWDEQMAAQARPDVATARRVMVQPVPHTESGGSHCLLRWTGDLYEINCAGVAYRVLQDWWVIGTAWLALGFISGALSRGAQVTPALAADAILFTSRNHTGTSPDSELFRL